MPSLLLPPKARKQLNGNSNGPSCWARNKASLFPQLSRAELLGSHTCARSWGRGCQEGAGGTLRHSHQETAAWLDLSRRGAGRRGETVLPHLAVWPRVSHSPLWAIPTIQSNLRLGQKKNNLPPRKISFKNL